MVVTNDRLAVARATYHWFVRYVDKSPDDEMHFPAIIESLPEPPDDSPATLPAPTGPGLWWMFDTRAPHAGWRGQNVFTDTWFGKQQLVIRSPGFEDKPREGQLWVGPLVAPTAKGGE